MTHKYTVSGEWTADMSNEFQQGGTDNLHARGTWSESVRRARAEKKYRWQEGVSLSQAQPRLACQKGKPRLGARDCGERRGDAALSRLRTRGLDEGYTDHPRQALPIP